MSPEEMAHSAQGARAASPDGRGANSGSARALLGILSVCFLLRVVLILSGGQGYWPDENRYQRSRWAAKALRAGDVRETIQVLNRADHFLFKVIGVAPALLEPAVGASLKWPALFFSLFSVANIWLAWAIVRRLCESEWAALCAAGLLGLSSTFLYYSRHLVPYDTAMAFALLSLYVGLRRPLRIRDSVFCGLLASAAFLTYYGYWLLAGFALVALVLRREPSGPPRWVRALVSGLSLVLPCVAVVVAGAAAGGNLPQQVIEFAHNVSQGSYAEGWNLPFFFLWHAEHLFVLLWAAGVIYGIRELARGDRRQAVILCLGGIAFVYGGLVLFSSVLGKMVVYGRLVRQLVPFFCILSALLLNEARLFSRRGRTLVGVTLVLAIFQAAANFYWPFTQVFPPEFRQLAARKVAEFGPGKYETLFVHHIYPRPGTPPRNEGEVILWRRHPLEYFPYQYEGYGPDQRRAFRTEDIRMRLCRHSDSP